VSADYKGDDAAAAERRQSSGQRSVPVGCSSHGRRRCGKRIVRGAAVVKRCAGNGVEQIWDPA
jgi:hypothetical protein